MPRKTDSHNPADWLLIAASDMDMVRLVERNSDLIATVEPLCDALVQVHFTERYPGFDLDDPDWPKLRAQVDAVTALLRIVQARLPTQS